MNRIGTYVAPGYWAELKVAELRSQPVYFPYSVVIAMYFGGVLRPENVSYFKNIHNGEEPSSICRWAGTTAVGHSFA
jgi:hypothetical protein